MEFADKHSFADREWWRHGGNPFGPLLGKYTVEQLVKLPSSLLVDIKPEEVTLFFSRLEYQQAIEYATDNLTWFSKLKSNPFGSLLTSYDPAQLAVFPVDLLINMRATEVETFFGRLGHDKAKEYAFTHNEWFFGLEDNPFGPLLSRYTPDQQVAFPPLLLVNINGGDLCVFFKALGRERRTTYIELNEEWFNGLDKEVLYSTIESKNMEDIDFKSQLLEKIQSQLKKPEELRQHHQELGRILLQFIQDEGTDNNQEIIKLLLTDVTQL